ncbi:MAG: hypothetical protein EAZ27_07965 [Cytophagales bacterium]|nr:MAG: hypothetical protein EAZ27_07965 [Cytophagales bacterium]
MFIYEMKNIIKIQFLFLIFSFSVFGQDVDQFFTLSLDAYNKQNYAGAIKFLDKIIALQPDMHEAIFIKGKCKLEAGEFNAALDNFNECVKNAPQESEYHFFMGFTEWKLKRQKSATKHLEDAIVFNPKHFLAHQILGSIYHELKMLTKAKEYYDKAMTFQPEFMSSTFTKSKVDVYKESYRSVLREYKREIQLEPNNALVYFNNGILQAVVRDNYGAHSNFSKCLEINPDFSFSYYYRGLVSYNMKKFKDAIMDFHRFSKQFPDDEMVKVLMETINDQSNIKVIEGENDEIMLVAEVMPEFEGGHKAMQKFIAENLEYPEWALKKKIQGRVLINFVIDSKGDIKYPAIIKGIGGGCELEAMRVIMTMPKWKPGKQNGKNISVKFTLPVVFAVSE